MEIQGEAAGAAPGRDDGIRVCQVFVLEQVGDGRLQYPSSSEPKSGAVVSNTRATVATEGRPVAVPNEGQIPVVEIGILSRIIGQNATRSAAQTSRQGVRPLLGRPQSGLGSRVAVP